MTQRCVLLFLHPNCIKLRLSLSNKKSPTSIFMLDLTKNFLLCWADIFVPRRFFYWYENIINKLISIEIWYFLFKIDRGKTSVIAVKLILIDFKFISPYEIDITINLFSIVINDKIIKYRTPILLKRQHISKFYT